MAQEKWYVVEEIEDPQTDRLRKIKFLADPFSNAIQMGAEAMKIKIQERFDRQSGNARVVTTITGEEWEQYDRVGISVEY